ncbi:MAG: hypothetical protein KIT84_19315 [Labilithrix sp.]|nr:hypothetical protein [Labilithrix sp.]MCW5813185.1 hypothetical protein [Labilithrix sp.]
MTGLLLRDFTCAVCGAPRQTTERAVVVLCRHCGAVLAFAGDGWTETALAERHAAGLRQIVKPTAAEARLTALMLEMPAATGDRERWRLACEEQILLMAIVYPEHGVPIPTDPEARARHVREAVAMSEIATFDPEVGRRLGAYSAAAVTLTQGDPVAAARAMLAAARGYYDALLAHPGAPPGALREGAAHHAREMVRAAIGGYASLLGVRAVERIRVEVLADAAVDVDVDVAACPKCGGPLDPPSEGLARCRHCGAVTSVSRDDAWTTAQLALWGIARAELVRRDDLDGPAPVLAAMGGFLWTSARTVPPASAAELLRRAIPWVTHAQLMNGFDLLSHAVNDEQRALLDALRIELADWTPDPAARPLPHVPVTDFAPPTPADEAAWIESALALYRRRGGPLLELLGQCLSAMQVAAVHETAVGLSPRAAMELFERARPGYDKAAMRAELEKLIPGYDLPRVRAFTTALADLLSRER